jgi:hypothetical protein
MNHGQMEGTKKGGEELVWSSRSVKDVHHGVEFEMKKSSFQIDRLTA